MLTSDNETKVADLLTLLLCFHNEKNSVGLAKIKRQGIYSHEQLLYMLYLFQHISVATCLQII